jgi:nucleotide-binding universal stress UspA family protein
MQKSWLRKALQVGYLAGRAWARLEAIRQAGRFDLVVVATHGRTGLAHMLLGSVAERVIRRCPTPVLTVRPRAKK